MKRMGLFSILAMAVMFIACKPVVTPIGGSPSSGENSSPSDVQVSNIRSASVGGKESATVILAWQANGSIKLACSPKAGNLENEVTLDENQTQFTVTGLEYEKEYTFYWRSEKGSVASLKVTTPAAGKVQLNEEEKETLFQERLLTYLTKEKKVEIFNEILEAKREDETFLSLLTPEEIESLQDHTLTDTEKLAIFEEIYSGIRTSDWIISELTDDEKERIYNDLLSDERKAAIFDEILEAKRGDETFLSLLTDEEKNAIYEGLLTNEKKVKIFEEIYEGKRTSAWIISQLTDAEMELIIGSLTAEDLQVLLDAQDTVPPAKVTDFAATIVGDKTRLSWTDSSDDDVLCYEIKFSTAAASRSVRFDADSIIVPQGKGYAYLNDLMEDTKYTFTICAMDRTGNKSEVTLVECTVWKQDVESLMDISNSYYNGVLLYISEEEIPEDANVRRVLLNDVLVAQTDYNEPNEDRYKENEWGYPYVKKGSTYNFKIQYLKNETVLKEMEIDVKAKSGLGELKTVKSPVWDYEDYFVTFTQQPEVTLNGNPLTSTTAYALAQPFKAETFAYFAGINFEGLTYDSFEIARALVNDQPEEKITLDLRYIFPSEKYGDYCWKFLTNEQEKAFVIDWENYSPYFTLDRSYDGLKFTIDSAVIPANAEVRDIFMDGTVIQRSDSKELARSLEFAYPYVEKGKIYEISIHYYDNKWVKVSDVTQNVIATGGKGDVEVLTAPVFKVNSAGVLHTEVYPEFKIGDEIISGSEIPGNGYYVSELGYGDFDWINSRSWGDRSAWNYVGDSFPEDWDMGEVIANSGFVGKDLDYYYTLFYEWTDLSSGTDVKYRKNFIEAKQAYFSIDWNSLPNVIRDVSDDETVGVKIEYNITQDDIDISRTEGVILFVNDMPTMPIYDPSGVLEVPYVEPGKTYKVELKGIFADETFYSIGRPLTIVPKTGLLSVIQTGEFSIDNNTGALKITKEPKLRLDDQTLESGYMYLLDVLYKGNLHSFESQEPFMGTECNIAEAIFGRDIDPGLENAEIKIRLAAALELGTEDNPLYCFVQFTTDKNTDGLFDVNLNWSQISRPVIALTGEEILGIKLKINEVSIPAEANGISVSWGLEGDSSNYKEYPVSQTEIEIPDVIAGSTYKIYVQYYKQEGYAKRVMKKFTLTAIPVKGSISFEGGSYSVENGILSFAKPVVKVGGVEASVSYGLILQYQNPDFPDYIRTENFYNLVEGNTKLLASNYDYYKENNITEFTYSIIARNSDFSAIVAENVPFTVDWSQVRGPYEIISDGSKGIKFRINEEYLPEDYDCYYLLIDDIYVVFNGTGNVISYPYVLPGVKYHIELVLWGRENSSIKFEYTPETGDVSLESPGSFSMNNGFLTLDNSPVINRMGTKIENEISYYISYKMKYKNQNNYDSNSVCVSFKNKVNIFRNVSEFTKKYYDGYAYKIYAVSELEGASYFVPLMDDYVEESVDWDNIVKAYEDLSSEAEPGVKLKINELEIPDNAKYIELSIDGKTVLKTEVTEGDIILYYPFVSSLGNHSFWVFFRTEENNGTGNSISGNANVKRAYSYDVESTGEVKFEDGELTITAAPVISFPEADENPFVLENYFEIKADIQYSNGSFSSSSPKMVLNETEKIIYDFSDILEYEVNVFAVYRKEINENDFVVLYVSIENFCNN